jgi:hypothetical protein
MCADGGTVGGLGFANANPLIHLNHITDNEFGAHSLTEAPSASQGSPLRIHDHMRLAWALPQPHHALTGGGIHMAWGSPTRGSWASEAALLMEVPSAGRSSPMSSRSSTSSLTYTRHHHHHPTTFRVSHVEVEARCGISARHYEVCG